MVGCLAVQGGYSGAEDLTPVKKTAISGQGPSLIAVSAARRNLQM